MSLVARVNAWMSRCGVRREYQILKMKVQKAGEGGCLNVEAIEEGAYNWGYGSEIKEE